VGSDIEEEEEEEEEEAAAAGEEEAGEEENGADGELAAEGRHGAKRAHDGTPKGKAAAAGAVAWDNVFDDED
jgi:hypothetical protein